jgi:hypothetical protein
MLRTERVCQEPKGDLLCVLITKLMGSSRRDQINLRQISWIKGTKRAIALISGAETTAS